MPKLDSIDIKNFKSNTGFVFDNISLSYQLYGQEIGDSPIILVNHSLTGNSSLTGDKGWWSEIVGIDKTIDLNYFTVIAFDIPGNGYYHPTIENYMELSCKDIAKIFYLGLEKIGVSSLFAIVGGSIGGGITWEMASLKNKFAENIIPVACDWQTSDWILANTYLQKRILKNSKNPIKKILEITLDKKLIKSDLEKIKKKIFRKSHFRGNKEIINFVSGELKNKVGVETFYKDINEIYNFFEFFGYKIISSDVSVWGPLTKKKLERGQWRFLSKDEISILKML